MNRTVIVAVFVALMPLAAEAQTCFPTQQSIGWTQPNNVAIANQNAIRWPTDASLRVAYSGTWCPTADQLRLQDEDGNEIAAQVRIRAPFSLVTNSAPPQTIIEIDPIPELEPRSDYFLTINTPDPALSLYREVNLEFRTKRGKTEPMPDFQGILSVGLDGDRCQSGGPFMEFNDTNPACPLPNRLRVGVRFLPLDRPEIAYAIYRTSTTPLDENGADIVDQADNEPLLVGFQNGARDLFGTGVPERNARVTTPYYPLPRRECYAVLALDEYGRERGDLNNEVCALLEPLDICPEGCDPVAMMCMAFPAPNPFETNPPISGQLCDNVGLAGADPEAAIPEVDAFVDVDGDGGVSGPMTPGADGGGASSDDDDDDKAGPPLCGTIDGQPALPLMVLAFIAFFARRRRV